MLLGARGWADEGRFEQPGGRGRRSLTMARQGGRLTPSRSGRQRLEISGLLVGPYSADVIVIEAHSSR